MRQEQILEELLQIKKELQQQKKALMKAIKNYNEVNYKINRICNKLKKEITDGK